MATVSLGNLSKQKPYTGKVSGQSTAAAHSSVRASLTIALMMISDVAGVLLALLLALNIEFERLLGANGGGDSVLGSGTPLSWLLGYLACFIVALLLVSPHQ